MKDVFVKNLLNDYFDNERLEDEVYESWSQIIFEEVKTIREITSSEVDDLREEIKNLWIRTSSKQGKIEGFETIMKRILDMIKRESIGYDDVMEIFPILRLFPNFDLSFNLESKKSDWIKAVLKGKRYRNISALHLCEYRATQLEKVFSNVNKNHDEISAEAFFTILNEANMTHCDKVNILKLLAEEWKDFKIGQIAIYNQMIESLISRKSFSNKVNVRMLQTYQRLQSIGWTAEESFNTIELALKKCSTDLGASKICKGLNITIDFAIGSEIVQNVLRKDEVRFDDGEIDQLEFQQVIHKIALEKFNKSREKPFDELLADMEDLNSFKESRIMENLKNEWKDLQKVSVISFDNIETKIESYKKADIKTWSKKLSEGINPSRFERIAVVIRGYEIFSNHQVRDVQKLTLLLLYKPEAGTLAQVNTGEGKTGVAAMLAVLFAIEGKKVDIVSSSKELAKPQSKYLQPFYEMFSLSSSHNDVSGKKQAYECNVLYGAIDDFEADVLRDEYNKNGTRSKRPFEIVIVDEVDSMLIDGKNSSVRLSSAMPGMDHLEPLLAAIWIHVGLVASKIHEQDGILYYVETDVDSWEPLDSGKSKVQIIREQVEEHMRLLLRDTSRITVENQSLIKDYPTMEVPNHLREFVLNNRLEKWIQKAVYARYQCTKDVDYVLKNQKIKIVDVDNTGIIQENMSYSEGLTQFLQIKHGAKIDSERLSTIYIAHPTFFKRYGKNIYGVTGTLGGSEEKEFLQTTYDVNVLVIPPFKIRQHIQLTPIVETSETLWKKEVIRSLISKVENGRACLVICSSIKKVEELKGMLSDFNYPEDKILLYRTQEDSSVVETKIKGGQIIFSTNIAGRGTDISLTDEVNMNGGLHVCLTFLPENIRVENQNRGRTSRTGNPGTSQFVLHDLKNRSVEELRTKRDMQNDRAFQNAAKEVKNVLLRATVFQKFCQLLDFPKAEVSDSDTPEDIVKSAIEERFGIWLKMNEEFINNENEYLRKFSEFEDVLRNDKISGESVKSPFYFIQSARLFINNKKFESAIKECSKAITLDRNYAENAYYNRGYARLALKSSNSVFINDAIEDFGKARDLIEKREKELQIVQQSCSTESTELTQQLARKLNLYNAQKSAINQAIGYDIKDLETQLKNLQKYKTSMESDLKDFVSLEELQKKLDVARKDHDKEEEAIKLENAILSFKTKEEIKKDIEGVEVSVKEVDNLKKFKGVLFESKAKNLSVKVKLLEIKETFGADYESYENELQEFQENGYIGGFSIAEVKPIDWWSVVGVFAIGLGQIFIGAAIAIFSVGSAMSVGLGVLMEGISDVITGIKDGIINRNFSWKNWGIQKAISYTISIVCAGMSALKNAMKTVYAAAKGVLSSTTTVFTQIVKGGWKLVAKKIGLELSKGVAKELATALINFGVDSLIISDIEQEITRIVQPLIEKALLEDENIKKLLQIDNSKGNTYYQNIILEKAMKILTSTTQQNELLSVLSQIVKGIASQKVPGVGTLITTIGVMKALVEIETYVPTLTAALKKDLEKEVKRAEIIEKQQDSSQGKVQGSSADQTKEDVNQFVADKTIDEPNGDIDISETTFEQIKSSTHKIDITRNIAIGASKHITNVFKAKIIQPAVQYASNFAVGKAFAECDASVNKQIKKFQSVRRINVNANKDRDGLLDASYKENHKNPKNMAFAEKMIEEARNGSKLGLTHLESLADSTGSVIQVLDKNGKVATVIGDESSGLKVIQVQYHADGGNGHWTLPGNIDAPGNGKNNCLLNVLASQTGQNPDTLRKNLADNMKANIVSLANTVPDLIELQNNPKSIFTGGARYNGNIGNTLFLSQGKRSHQTKPKGPQVSNAKGHPEGHIPKGIPSTGIDIDCAENYSRGANNSKTAFDNRNEAMVVMDILLNTPKAQDAFDNLNRGSDCEPLEFSKIEIENAYKTAGRATSSIPKVFYYNDGIKNTRPLDMQSYVFVLRHQRNMKADANAEVFLQTAYPKP